MRALPLLLLLFSLSACSPGETLPPPRFLLRPATETGLAFANTIREDAAAFNMVDFFYIYNGAGVAVGDVNNDGLPDLYFSGNMTSGRLYLNRGRLRFEDITESAGVVTDGWATGVTFADVNADGYLDLYVCRAGPHPAERRANLLYLNNGPGSGPGQAVTFSEQAEAFGLADTSYSTQAAFFDYDKDDDLDLFLLNHSNEAGPNQIRTLVTDGTALANDRLYRQEDDGTFTDVTVEAGIVYPGLSLGVGVSDLDGDGWEDVYVSNDFMAHDYLYMNDGDGTFSEQGSTVLKHHSYAAMGHDLADINNDGRVDIMTLDMRPPDHEQQKRMAFPMTEQFFEMSLQAGYHPQYWRNTLQLNNGFNADGALTFSEIGQYAGVEATDWSWSPLLADFDNDGLRDLWITNGYRRAVIDLDFIDEYARLQRRYGVEGASGRVKEMTVQLYDMARVDRVFRNRGDLTFEDVAARWGITQPTFSNGGAYADLDNDGDLDVVVNSIDTPAALYENTTRDHHFLKLSLRGSGKNTHGLGADIRLFCDGRLQHYHHAVARGYQSSMDYRIHFGLGECDVVDSLRIVWPNDTAQRLIGIPADTTLPLNQADAQPFARTRPTAPRGLLTDAEATSGLHYRHQEEPYRDFDRQRLLPHKHSQQGPGLAVGDVNGDGLDDVFIGGAFRHTGHLFVQQPSGAFIGAPLTTQTPKYEEDLGALFFDADNDGDSDLYVASGSSEYLNGSEYLQDRFYLNDGQGRFTPAPDALPTVQTSSACVLAADYDRDGDLDLFVCGRLDPLRYPLPGRSYLLRNDTGSGSVTFTDVTDDVGSVLRNAGMVTGGLWTDFNTDGRVDLILVGEFMPLRFFENTAEGFRDGTGQTGLDATAGWWNSITGGDFDRDGDTDYVAGNLGLNTRYTASPAEPVSIYGQDFDRNGHIDPLLTHFMQGKEVPVPSYDDFVTQMPEQKLYVQDYETYGKATLFDLFSPQQLQDAFTLRATRFESIYVENLGQGRFSLRPLPGRAQLGPLFGLLADDVDRDGRLDVLAVGNSYAPDVVTGRHDALIGLYLRGDGQGAFEAVPHQESGFFVDGDAKGLARLYNTAGTPLYVVTRNDGPTRVFTESDPHSDATATAEPLDAYALITFPDGTTERRELYYGAGYLSQSSRRFRIPPGARDLTLYHYDGTARTVSAPTAQR